MGTRLGKMGVGIEGHGVWKPTYIPTHLECQKACQFRASSLHVSREFCGCYWLQ